MEGLGQGVAGLPGWPLVPGTTLGKYRIVRFLGEGGMGAVYEGVHLEMGKRVAIKTISPALAAIPEARARFVLEAQLTSRIRHPHTVDVTDICMDSGQAFLVMEYLDGEDLGRHLRDKGALPLDEVIDIALPILAAVAAAHDEGIVHRDLKPPNIFLARTRDGAIQPKVLDFGISKAPACSPIRTSGAMLGSPSYFAPEQVQDQKAVSPASDQYALGVILYECVTGRLPHDGSNLAAIFQAIVMGTYPPPRTYRPDLPEDYQSVITRAMSLSPRDRYADLRQMGRALIPFASPRTQLLWRDQFSAAPAARVMDGAARMPVTEQTPGPERSPLVITASLAVAPRPAAAQPEPSPNWIPPTRSPSLESSDPLLAVPRRFRLARWALAGGSLVVAASLAAVIAMHGHTRTRATATPPPAPAPAAVPAPRAPAEEALRDPTPEPDGRTVRHARSAPRLHFGPNKAPIIE